MAISNFMTIDESILLPGNTNQGSQLSMLPSDTLHPRFLPMATQLLAELDLTVGGLPLTYTLDNAAVTLTGLCQQQARPVFEASLSQLGHFKFTLFQPLDRPMPENIIAEDLQQHQLNLAHLSHTQQAVKIYVPTEQNKAYQLKFSHQNGDDTAAFIVQWGEHFIDQVSTTQGHYLYTLNSENNGMKPLIITSASGISPTKFLKDISLSEIGQDQILLPFEYEDENNAHHTYNVNVTADRPILIQEHHSHIICSQPTYQPIVIRPMRSDIPPVQLDLTHIFDAIRIDPHHRAVEVEQYHHSQVYTLSIGDQRHKDAFITISDIVIESEHNQRVSREISELLKFKIV